MNEPSLKHPGRWIWLILLVPVAIGLMRLRFEVDVLSLLPADIEAVQGLKLYQEHFANARELLITLESPEAEVTEKAAADVAAALRVRTNLVETVTWRPPWLEHPEQAAELMGFLWLNQPPEALRALAERLAPENLPALLAEARDQLSASLSPGDIARLSYDPFGFTVLPENVAGAAPSFMDTGGGFSSPDGTFRTLFVRARGDLPTYRECEPWLHAVSAVVAGTLPSGSAGNVRVGYTGRPAFVTEVATGMERDIKLSVGGTAIIIAILFWLAHRRLKPMFWLLTLLAAVLGATLALGGLVFSAINVVSMGFAAILLGLAVDYAVVHYQEALAHPRLTIPQIRHAIAPSILWAAVTTIAAFLVLNLGGLPGLAQLGTLVGLGVALAALIMIFEFLPPLFPGRSGYGGAGRQPAVPLTTSRTTQDLADWQSAILQTDSLRYRSASSGTPRALLLPPLGAAVITALLILGSLTVLFFGLPGIDPTAKPLRPRNSPAYSTLERVQAQLTREGDPLWLLVGGRSEQELANRLAVVQTALETVTSNQLLAGFTLPATLWPNPAVQSANCATALRLADQSNALHQAASAAGFNERALALADGVLSTWRRAAATPAVFWPTNDMSRWLFEKFTARSPTNLLALGLVTLPGAGTNALDASSLEKLRAQFPRDDVWLSGWQLLGTSIYSRVKSNFALVVGSMVGLVLLSLWAAFRRPAEIVLSIGVLTLSGLCLLAVMRLAGWSWNLLNLMAVPLILGTGVDYGIFTQLALKRHGGDLGVAYQSVGRALLLCGGTAIAGFGSLAFSSNAGMASLGAVCAVGIAFNMLIGVFLLPRWWQALAARSGKNAVPDGPSVFYQAFVWRLGLALVRVVPHGFARRLGRALAGLYWRFARRRREIVIQNLAPALNGNIAQAQLIARRLFRNFLIKIVDLLRYEAGLSIAPDLGVARGWEHFLAARARYRGVLLLTPHLGNWEFGAPFLLREQVDLRVVTLDEPGGGFTRLRETARARSNIETVVIGNDPFAFVDIIRRLEEGATVALLVDRPPRSSAVNVNLFGRPYAFSVAAAELARACGCALVPVYVVWTGSDYAGQLMPPIEYDQQALRDRRERQALTQRIADAFAPVLRQHLEQWYHFVPVWNPEEPDPSRKGKGIIEH
jgi:uncharacterized protein